MAEQNSLATKSSSEEQPQLDKQEHPSAALDRKMNDSTMALPRHERRKNNNAANVRRQGSRFGLHDWKRLLAVSKDLAQRRGEPIRKNIPRDEIRRHNKKHDGWIVLRGKVYNIGPYLPYHPGGIEIFEHVLGKEADTMFD